MLEAYRVVQVSGENGSPAPPEVTERFEGRAWTLHQLEQRGVRITSGTGWYLALGRDWQLRLEPI
jgi:hypothetical protein